MHSIAVEICRIVPDASDRKIYANFAKKTDTPFYRFSSILSQNALGNADTTNGTTFPQNTPKASLAAVAGGIKRSEDTQMQHLLGKISSLKDKDIVDNRTDVQKAESAGFDRKTSFRNVK